MILTCWLKARVIKLPRRSFRLFTICVESFGLLVTWRVFTGTSQYPWTRNGGDSRDVPTQGQCICRWFPLLRATYYRVFLRKKSVFTSAMATIHACCTPSFPWRGYQTTTDHKFLPSTGVASVNIKRGQLAKLPPTCNMVWPRCGTLSDLG